MTTDRARQLVLMLWIGAVGIQFANQLTGQIKVQDGKPSGSSCSSDYFVKPHKLFAGALVFTILGGLAEWLPGLAVAFAAGVDVAALLGPAVAPKAGDGKSLFDRLASLVKASA